MLFAIDMEDSWPDIRGKLIVFGLFVVAAFLFWLFSRKPPSA